MQALTGNTMPAGNCVSALAVCVAAPSAIVPLPARSGLVARKDAPVCTPTCRAVPELAVVELANADGRRAAFDAYLRDTHAMSTISSRASLLRTWVKCHHLWHGLQAPAFPLTPFKIACVASTLNARKHRSFSNSVARAKDHHLELGFSWPEELQR